jgi:hypothetical protein
MSFNSKINSICTKKLEELTDKGYLKIDLLAGSFFAGGLITSIAKDEKIKDYDLFFTNPKSAKKAINFFLGYHAWSPNFDIEFVKDDKNPNLHRGKLVSKKEGLTVDNFIENFNRNFSKNKSNSIHPQFLSNNAMMLSNGVQLIFRFVGEPDEVFSTFDYEHCKAYWRPCPTGFKPGEVVFRGKSLESLAKNEVMYTGNTRFVLAAISRLNKFITRGWTIAPSSLLAIASSASKICWENEEQLREELLGIYGIDPKVLEEIIKYSRTEKDLNLDKVIEMLGEV